MKQNPNLPQTPRWHQRVVRRRVEKHRRKLTQEDVDKIRTLSREGKLKQREIAEMFGINRHHVRFIANGSAWKHEPFRRKANRKLTEDDVRRIHQLLSNGGFQEDIAK